MRVSGLHKHCLGYLCVIMPDGLCGSIAGPFPGSNNDHQKIQKSSFLATLAARCPGFKVLGDSGFSYNPSSNLVRCPPGGPFPMGSPMAQYSKALASAREPVEWPFGHVSMAFPCLDSKRFMKTNTAASAMHRVGMLLNNCLLCMGHGSHQVSEYFNCSPPKLSHYVA